MDRVVAETDHFDGLAGRDDFFRSEFCTPENIDYVLGLPLELRGLHNLVEKSFCKLTRKFEV
jgi:hypothetical protein